MDFNIQTKKQRRIRLTDKFITFTKRRLKRSVKTAEKIFKIKL